MLEINDLEIIYRTEKGDLYAVNGAHLEIQDDEIVGVIGESGSGKTTVGKGVLGLLPENGEIRDGEILYKGEDLTQLTTKQLKKRIRWKEISLIPQHAMNGFDPLYTVGQQIVQVIRYHENGVSKKEAKERARDLFTQVGIPADRVDDYPHQFSGGMAQRGMIALALALQPDLIIADEATTALDVLIQERIIQLFQSLLDDIEGSMMLITHDISVVGRACDKVAVMYGGRVVEFGDVDTVIHDPKHPYTMGLRQSIPDIIEDGGGLTSIPGVPPDLIEPEAGCSFAPRCPFSTEECWNVTPQPEEYADGDRFVECHRADEAEELQVRSRQSGTWSKDEIPGQEFAEAGD